jgi:hypothetical protein
VSKRSLVVDISPRELNGLLKFHDGLIIQASLLIYIP